MRKMMKIILSLSMIIAFTFIVGCGEKNIESAKNEFEKSNDYDGRAFYELFVRSFNDSNGDGIGDIKGVTQKLDYLKELGIKGIWLMPINSSPSYHGYDVSDYYSINKDYGTMEDFEEMIKEAHKRDIKIIMDLVINHTSKEHPWFKEARKNKDSKYRDYYIFSDDMDKEKEISPMKTKSWSKNGNKNELYYSIFWEGMPDLNMDNPVVVDEMKKTAKFYLDKGLDGFRLDAAKWIFEEKDKNIAFWKDFNEYVKKENKDAMLVGEVWDNQANTLGYTKSLDSFFDFSVGEKLIDKVNSRSIANFPNEYSDEYGRYKKENPSFVPAPFVSNHDVNRPMSKLNSDDNMKIAACMYLTLPGTPYLYYGEELGMKGVKPDERLREPFIWSDSDKKQNTSWIDSKNDSSKIALDVEEKNKDSIFNFYKDILNIRDKYDAIKYGGIEGLKTSDKGIMVMRRTYKNQEVYVAINSLKEDKETEFKEGKYEVLYSNVDRKKDLKIDKSLNLQNNEILILLKL